MRGEHPVSAVSALAFLAGPAHAVAHVLAQLLAPVVPPVSGLPVTVIGAGDCPTPAEVEARLRELLPVRPLDRPVRTASVEREPAGVRVIVREPEGAVVAERLLPTTGGCAEAAASAALAIAAWETEGHSEFGAAPPAVAVRPPPPPPAPPPDRDAFDLGAGAAASLADSWRPGIVGRAGWIPGGRGLGLGAFGAWEPERSAALAGGQVHWSRAALGAGPTFRLRGERLALEGRVEGAVGFLSLRGEGFGTDLSSLGMAPGVGGGGRLLLPLGSSVATWLDAGALFWLRRESGFTLPGGEESSLPRVTVLLSLGVSAGRFR
jgi:hypothetical protein